LGEILGTEIEAEVTDREWFGMERISELGKQE
jgi:hypothetical protein